MKVISAGSVDRLVVDCVLLKLTGDTVSESGRRRGWDFPIGHRAGASTRPYKGDAVATYVRDGLFVGITPAQVVPLQTCGDQRAHGLPLSAVRGRFQKCVVLLARFELKRPNDAMTVR